MKGHNPPFMLPEPYDAQIEGLEMRSGIKHIAILVLVFIVFFGGRLMAANGVNSVVADGDRISIHAEGMVLGELLMIVENMTGVQFRVDELMAEKEIFVDFEGLPLPKGIKKILYSLNFAVVYDETGKLRKVVILGRGKDFSMKERREVEDRASESYQSGSIHTVPFTPQGGSDVSTRSKAHPSAKGPLQTYDPPVDKKKADDGPPARQEVVMEGPPLNEPYSIEGPPDTENQISEGPQDVGNPDPPPAPDSKGSQVDGPPLDWKYEVDGPPGWENM